MELEQPRPAATIPAPIEIAQTRAPVLLAQVDNSTYRIGQLEERVRVLNGRIEEMNFLMLQMQEQMRQMREDNEFRFQELEGGGSNRTEAAPRPAANEDQAVVDQPEQEPADGSGTLGTITFDESGELVDTETEPQDNTQDQTQTASLPRSEPEQLYQAAYGYVLSGDYPQAEANFSSYISQYPDGAQVSDAYFWLGEAQYSQGAYHNAAKTLLTAHKQYPNVAKAPEMLLKLGMSLAALDNRDTACATYREVLTRYPDSSDAVKEKVAVEQSRMSC
ncbi:MAG: tol-pal system protein YbgF [Hyphomicrobiales bacterium]|nr:tol-pal system protein YbgF [Hyphomicrobiales bacterium]MCP5000966.1 tol-pal system protein YbgF [Hyphomicrobiales bacterium]